MFALFDAGHESSHLPALGVSPFFSLTDVNDREERLGVGKAASKLSQLLRILDNPNLEELFGQARHAHGDLDNDTPVADIRLGVDVLKLVLNVGKKHMRGLHAAFVPFSYKVIIEHGTVTVKNDRGERARVLQRIRRLPDGRFARQRNTNLLWQVQAAQAVADSQ